MRSILVVNPKGGCGKTTLATNLAGGLASSGARVLLWDLDRQQSAMTWLSMRPGHCSRILRLDRREQSGEAADSRGDAWLVVDSPAALHGKGLSHALKLADKVLVPIQPSVFDMAATADFLQTLGEEKSIRKGRAFVGVVGVRVDPRTRAAATLEAFLHQFELPILAFLRDSQVYPNAAFNGLSIFDLPPSAAERDQAQWQAILGWVADARRPAVGAPSVTAS